MTSSYPAASHLREAAFVGIHSSMTIEELDCEKRGYKLTKTVLGTGAYAKVKLAYVMESKVEKDKRLSDDLAEKGHNMVAIKIVCKKKAPTDYLTKFMPREIDSLNATCRHHNVTQLYETFHADKKIYLVMEFASRGDLLDFINSRSRRGVGIGEAFAKTLFRQLAEGVAHCHRRNVVHRDLKCENILLDSDNIIKVSDFGFATRYPTNKCKLLSTFCGSYAYAAPEILLAQHYDGKCADVWSMGIILYAMVCGRLPFNDSNLNSLIVQTKGKLTFPTRNFCSQECQHMIRSILTWDPRKRITMSQIFNHVWLTGEATKASSVSSQSKMDGKRINPSFIQKEIEQALEEKRFPLPVSSPLPVRQVEKRSPARTPVPKHGWSSSTNTPEPHTTTKHLHKRDYRLPAKSQALAEPIKIDSPKVDSPIVEILEPPRSTTPCPRSFTPTSQPKKPRKKELPVKVAEISTKTGYQCKPNNLSKETFVVMKKAREGSLRAGQNRSGIRQSSQKVWKYVTNLSSRGRASVTPTGREAVITPTTKAKNKSSVTPNLPSVPLVLNAVTPTPPTVEKPVKTAIPCRQLKLFSAPRTSQQGSNQTKLNTAAQTHTAVQESAKRLTDLKSYDPYLASLAIHNSEKTATLRLSSAMENSKRYPFIRQKGDVQYDSVIRSIRKPNIKGGLRIRKGNTAAENRDRKQVTFIHGSRQS
ncbi:MAP/microtubule affinity-regulating kinase 4-like [Montipora foliosa]|uniref:MAP/microtubule affinity-regulating kinase 4-like n=1 Tax=Montipora foliosa TaxID=591990 RepID=UPI0035F0FC73